MFAHRFHRPGVALALLCGAALTANALLTTASAASQEKVVIYRCTDASGALTIQNNVPCPKGSKQERRVIEAAPAAGAPPVVAPKPAPRKPVTHATPAPQPAPPPTPTPAPREPAIADADADTADAYATTGETRLPPPVLYECRTYNDDTYLSENGTPQQRCVALNTTGLGGISAEGAGAACEMKTDRCQRVPDGALCDSWRKRLREAESALRFGVPEDHEFAQAEVERIGRIVRESVCTD
jgi:Domain of unknown function (DUF4124)